VGEGEGCEEEIGGVGPCDLAASPRRL
jgi:hypothetical protein